MWNGPRRRRRGRGAGGGRSGRPRRGRSRRRSTRAEPVGATCPSQSLRMVASRPRMTSMSLPRSVSTTEVAKIVECSGVADSQAVSSIPSFVVSSIRAGSSTFGRPCSSTAPITVPQETPKRLATEETERASSPTARQHSSRARRVRLARRAISSLSSVQLRPQSPIVQENRRLPRRARPVSPPPRGRGPSPSSFPSSVPVAPQAGQNERCRLRLDSSHTSPSISLPPGRRSRSCRRARPPRQLLSPVVRGLASFLQSVNRKNGEAPGLGGGCSIRRQLSRQGPPFVEKRRQCGRRELLDIAQARTRTRYRFTRDEACLAITAWIPIATTLADFTLPSVASRRSSGRSVAAVRNSKLHQQSVPPAGGASVVGTSLSVIDLAEHRLELGVGPDLPDLYCAAAGDGYLGGPFQRLLRAKARRGP